MIDIKLDGNGNINSKIKNITILPNSITHLQYNLEKENYIITSLKEIDKIYNFKIFSSSFSLKNEYSYTYPTTYSAFISSSCFLIYNSHVTCINTFSKQIEYSYLSINSNSISLINSGNIINLNLGENKEIKGALIKYWSNTEILLYINSNGINPLIDINLLCYMLNIVKVGNDIQIKSIASYIANEKVTDQIDYCQIELIKSSTSNIYVSIYLTYYF